MEPSDNKQSPVPEEERGESIEIVDDTSAEIVTEPLPEAEPVSTPPEPAVVEPTVAPVETPSSVPVENPPVVRPAKKHTRRRTLLIVLLALLLVGGGVVLGMYLTNKKAAAPSPKTTVQKQTPETTVTSSTDPELAKFINPTTGEKWYSSPKAISAQGYMKSELASSYTAYPGITIEEQMQQSAPSYQEVGAHNGKTIILVALPAAMDNTADAYLFEKDASGNVAAILKPQARATISDATLSNMKDQLSSAVSTYDTTTHYDSLNVPAELAAGSRETVAVSAEALHIGGKDTIAASDSVKYIDVAKFGGSQLKRIETAFADTKLTNIGYQLRLPIGTVISMTYAPNGTTLEGYTFTNGASTQKKDYDGKTVYDPIAAIARGCSISTAQVTRADGLTLKDLTAVGKAPSGRTVYEPTVTTSGLYKKAYDEYKQMNDTSAKSFEVYQKDHGLLLVENAKKELLVYVRETYSAVGGCAKPVVYLYPTTATTVSVKVGANVTVSDPLYPAEGWRGVWAEPSGKLTYLGQAYDSLFWEGQGYGDYPGITSGTVVKRADAAKTIRRQLTEQGLNAKESNDFMAFWESKIPNKSYVRLTWLGTTQMNTLAPLLVTPKPQTVIRVFLDMDGFDAPIKLPAQKLTKTERKGFTVVEWGGLTPLIRH